MSKSSMEFTALPLALDSGLLIVETTLELRLFTALIMVDQVAGSKNDLGIKISPTENIKILCSGSSVVRAQFQQVLENVVTNSKKLKFVHLPEGIHDTTVTLALLPAWLPQLSKSAKSAEWWVVMHSTKDSHLDVDLVRSLGRIRAAAKKADTRVLLILSMPTKTSRRELENIADEFIRVEACEPDVTGAHGLSFDSCSLSELGALGASKVMCLIGQSAEGITHKFERFIAKKLEHRVMAKLRGHGLTFEQVGEIVRRDKATVHRRLSGRPVRPEKVSQAWIDLVKEYYGAVGRKAEKGGKRGNDVDDMDDLDDESDD